MESKIQRMRDIVNQMATAERRLERLGNNVKSTLAEIDALKDELSTVTRSDEKQEQLSA